MKKLLLTIGLIFSFQGFAQDSGFKSEWRACKTKKDCVAVKGCCGWVTASKKFQKDVEKFETSVCADVHCFAPPKFEDNPTLKCEKRTCVR